MNLLLARKSLRWTVWLCAIPLAAFGQDRRIVAEPKAPPICTVIQAQITYGPGVVNLMLTGEDVTTKDIRGTAIVTACSDVVFVPFGAQAWSDTSTEQPLRVTQ
jgi:hypothetical protein